MLAAQTRGQSSATYSVSGAKTTNWPGQPAGDLPMEQRPGDSQGKQGCKATATASSAADTVNYYMSWARSLFSDKVRYIVDFGLVEIHLDQSKAYDTS